MSHLASSTPAASTRTDQRVRLVLEAEIFQDPDGGPDSLIVTTDQLACEPVSPARLLGMVAEARTQLDAMERLAKVFEAEDTLAAIIDEHNIMLIEVDLMKLDAPDRTAADKLRGVVGIIGGRKIAWVPKEQDPIRRTAVIAELVNDLTGLVAQP